MALLSSDLFLSFGCYQIFEAFDSIWIIQEYEFDTSGVKLKTTLCLIASLNRFVGGEGHRKIGRNKGEYMPNAYGRSEWIRGLL